MSQLADELNLKFMADLGTCVGMQEGDIEMEATANDHNLRLVFIGGSHAARMAAAADRKGIEYVNLAMPGFRIREETIDTATIMLKETLQESHYRDVLIFQLLDNNIFFEAREDGSRALPKKCDDDNKYHIVGKLEYADHSVVKTLVNGITPLLRAGGDREKIILSPLPRYMKRCCKEKEHLTNKKESNYASKMGEALASIRDSMKDLIYGKRIRSFKVPNATQLIMGDDEESAAANLRNFWREDAVHMTDEGYDTLVEALAEMAISGTFKRPANTTQASRPPARSHSTPRGGMKRRQWVSEDDILAHRIYGNTPKRGGFRGSFRGGYNGGGVHGGRGGQRNRGGGRGGRGGGRGFHYKQRGNGNNRF
jgi:hypothetical protein